MLQSHVIEVNGTFIGAAVTTDHGFRFRAVHPRVDDLDGRVWASLAALRSAAGHFYVTGRLGVATPLAAAAEDAPLSGNRSARRPALARRQ